MSEYAPDKWLLLKVTNTTNNESHYRVFGSWYGGYLGSDSWRMNSGITKVTENDDYYFFDGSSGSMYVCRKGSYGASGYAGSVLDQLIVNSKKHNMVIEPLDNNVDPMKLEYQ